MGIGGRRGRGRRGGRRRVVDWEKRGGERYPQYGWGKREFLKEEYPI